MALVRAVGMRGIGQSAAVLRRPLAFQLAPSRILLSTLSQRPSASAGPSARRAFSTSPRASGWIPDLSGWVPAVPSVPSISGWVPSIIRGSSAPPPKEEVAAVAEEPAPPPAVEPPPPPPELPSVEAVTPVVDPSVLDPVHHFLTTSDVLIPTGTLDLSSLASSWGLHPIMRLESLFLHLHDSFPFLGYTPWYILIPTVTVLLRLALFPFTVRAQQNAARMAKIQPDMIKGMAKVKEAKAIGAVMQEQMATMEVKKLMDANGVNPLRNVFFPLVQGAVFMTMFFTWRGLSNAGLASMTEEGFGWVRDLSVMDPYYVLPVMSTALTLATIELGVDATTQVQTSTTRNTKLFLRSGLVLALPFMAHLPAAIFIYWTTNNLISLIQASLLRHPTIRTLLSIPLLPRKAHKGEPGYVVEPSFGEAFRDLQQGMRDKWEETQAKAEKARADKVARERESQPAREYVPKYVPARATTVGRVEKVAEGLVEGGTGGGERGEILAGKRKGGSKEEEKRARVLKARMKREAGQKE